MREARASIGIRAARRWLGRLTLVAFPAALQAAIPVSAEFISRAPDPRGGSPGYNTFNRLPDGRGITYAGFSHDFRGNNAVVVYDPVADAWQIVVPHTPWVEMPVPPATTVPPYEGRGLNFLSNRDDHATLVVDNQWWVLQGQVGATVVGNYRGVLNTQTWQWTIDDDPNAFGPTGASPGAWYNSASGWHPTLDVGYIFAGTRSGNPTDAFTRIERNAPGSSPPFRFTQYWNSESDTPAFQGAERLEYVSNQHFVRSGPYVYVYGGRREVRRSVPPYDPLYRINSYDLWQLRITDPPQLTILSTNTLPVVQRIEGMALLAYYDAARDFAVVTNGKLVNLYNYATGLWHNIPVLTPPDPDRESPSSQGAGHAGFYSPAVDEYIILGSYGKTYGLKLNYTGTTVPSAPLNVVATAGNASATVTFSPPLTDGGSPITSYIVTSNPAGGVDAQAGTTATTRNITNLVNGTPYTFTVVAVNAMGQGPPSAPSNAVTPSAGATVPGAPTNVAATAGNASATVSFLAPSSNGGSPITSYTVLSNPPGGVDAQAGTTATTRMITGLVNGTPYTFTVTATNAIGTGPPSAPSNSVTPATVPGAATGVAANAGNATASVSFSPPASNGGSPITGYTVTSSPAGGVDFHAGTAATTHLIGNLINGVSYTFTVVARNAIGSGAPSAPSNAVVPQLEATCAGFTDVAAASAFCPSVEWLRNRAITLGCSATQYCPDDVVSRITMAAFMQRTGAALTPTLLAIEDQPGAVDAAVQPVVCTSAALSGAPYPRMAQMRVAFSGLAAGSGVFALLPVASVDGGTTWSSPVQNAFRSRAQGGQFASLAGDGVIAIAPGTAYRLGVQLFPVSGASVFTGVRCQLFAEVVNQNGPFPPFDPNSGGLRGSDGDLR